MIRTMYLLTVWISSSWWINANAGDLDNPKPKPTWLAVHATYHGHDLRLALVLENQLMHLLDNPRRDGQVEPVQVAGKEVPKLAIHNLDTRQSQELAHRCRTSQFDGTLGLEAIPTRFLVIDKRAQVTECLDEFDGAELRRVDTQRLVIDDNGFWCVLVNVRERKYAFRLCSIARMSVNVLKSFPLTVDEVRESQFLGPAFDPSSAELGPGNAVNLILTRPEIKKIAVDKTKMEVTYYADK